MIASGEHPSDVDRQWLHDLGVAEGIDHLQDPEITAMRRGAYWDDACPRCGVEELTEHLDGPDAMCECCDTVSEPSDLTGAPACVTDLDVDSGSDTAQLVGKLESVTGWPFWEWMDELNTRSEAQAWHVPVWLAEKKHLPLHDPELGTILVGYPHRETDKAVTFNSGVYVLSLLKHDRQPAGGRGGDTRRDRYRDIDTWEQQVRSCVNGESLWSEWDWEYLQDSQYWPYSQMTRIV